MRKGKKIQNNKREREMKKKEGEEQREGSRDIEEERKSVRDKSDRACASASICFRVRE